MVHALALALKILFHLYQNQNGGPRLSALVQEEKERRFQWGGRRGREAIEAKTMHSGEWDVRECLYVYVHVTDGY